jgi:hypothetical protein
MGKPLCTDHDVTLDSQYFLSCIATLRTSAIGVFYTLCVDDQKARRGFPPLFCTGHANYIFLKLAPKHLRHLDQAHSSWKSTHVPFTTRETHSAAFATGIRFSANTARHKIFHINQPSLVSSACACSPTESWTSSNASRLMSLGYLFLIPRAYAIHMIVNRL